MKCPIQVSLLAEDGRPDSGMVGRSAPTAA